MKLFDNMRQRLVRKLIRPEDGYTYTGFQGGEPIKFYYQEDTGKYLVGLRSDTMYYAEPTLTGWSLCSSKYLPWGKTVDGYTYPQEPKETDFKNWMYGILDNICSKYFERLENITQKELKDISYYRKVARGETPFMLNKKSFCDIMNALESYWSNLRALEDILNVYFERGMMVDIIDKVVDVLEEELEPQFYDPELCFDINEDPVIMRWLTGLESDRIVDGRLLASAEELYDYLVEKKENNLKKVENAS